MFVSFLFSIFIIFVIFVIFVIGGKCLEMTHICDFFEFELLNLAPPPWVPDAPLLSSNHVQNGPFTSC